MNRSFYEPNYQRSGSMAIFQYSPNLQCSHDIITDCDPETEQISFNIMRMSIRGDDAQCSADYAQFFAEGGFEGMGDIGSSQVWLTYFRSNRRITLST